MVKDPGHRAATLIGLYAEYELPVIILAMTTVLEEDLAELSGAEQKVFADAFFTELKSLTDEHPQQKSLLELGKICFAEAQGADAVDKKKT